MEITITKMSPQDRDEIITMFKECKQSGDLVLDTDDPGARDIAGGRNLVARAQDRIIGWASIDPAGGRFKPGMASVSILVRPEYRRIGVGRALLNTAIDVATRSGIGTLVSGIVPRNVPALLLHKSCGFKAVGMMQKAGLAGGKWQDAVLLQRDCA
jgi:phosphinothricin acetyltransferase